MRKFTFISDMKSELLMNDDSSLILRNSTPEVKTGVKTNKGEKLEW